MGLRRGSIPGRRPARPAGPRQPWRTGGAAERHRVGGVAGLAARGQDAPGAGGGGLARLDRTKPGEIVAINGALSPFKAFVPGTGAPASSLARGRKETGNVFGRAFRAIGRAFRAVGRAFTGGG
jgi:hypothetical protein